MIILEKTVVLHAYIPKNIFTGAEWLTHSAVIADGLVIREIVPAGELPAGMPCRQLTGLTLVPAFIDLQIYGAYGQLFSLYPGSAALQQLVRYCREGGAALCLPTVATNTYEVIHQCIDAIRDYWQQGGEGVAGLHLEGPWINPVKRGAHAEELIHAPSAQTVTQLLDYGKDVIRLITLAPEVCSPEILALIRSYGIIISAGHSNASYDEAIKGFACGVTAVTHLFNAMSPLQHRAPGLAGAAMDSASVRASIIPDGYHVDYAALRIAKKACRSGCS